MGGGLVEWLYSLSIPALFVLVLGAMISAGAIGHFARVSREKRARKADEAAEERSTEGYLVSGVLGLLALLLAFTFSLALNRYEMRRELVTTEANAIGTSYLRAQFLDEPHRGRLSNLLVQYTDNRISLANAEDKNAELLATNDRLLTEIWAAVRAARESALSHGISVPLLATYNEVIDLDTERKVARRLRMPADVTALLLVYLVVTAGVLGSAVEGARGRRAGIVLFVLFALSVTVITDLNRPTSGWIRESQEPMLMLQRSLRQQPPQVFDKFSAEADATASPSDAH